jgi:hypothetical protein
MIFLAAIDRWLSSNITVNLKNTQRCIFIIFMYTSLINSPFIYCYEANLTGIPQGCYGVTYACRLTTDLIHLWFIDYQKSTTSSRLSTNGNDYESHSFLREYAKKSLANKVDQKK